jgi:competence protein ComGA
MELETMLERKTNQLIQKAIAFKASDIHILPTESLYTISFRKFGKLIPIETYPTDLGMRMITYFKFLSSLDISEKRKPQSGSFQKVVNDELYAFRISTLPSVYNKESLVARILLQRTALPIHQLTFHSKDIPKIKNLVETQQGILLITGATGSGKTTTLYSLIHHCSEELARHVISLEDPVERTQEKVLQIQVNERAGVTYASGLKAILRHTPDVIMIGEIRDKETAQIAFEAALTGHLVLSTVHAKNSVGCLYRLFDLGISLEDMEQGLIGIVAQTLVEKRESDERKAIFEVLDGMRLKNAIHSMKEHHSYELPYEQTLDYFKKHAEMVIYES